MNTTNPPFVVIEQPTPLSDLDAEQRARIEPFMAEWNRIGEAANSQLRPVLGPEVNRLRLMAEDFAVGSVERAALDSMFAGPIAGAAARSYMGSFTIGGVVGSGMSTTLQTAINKADE